MNSSRALVTGATGFVGRHITRHLLRAGWHVDAIVRPSSDFSPIADLGAVHIHQYTGTATSMQAIIDKAKPDVVFHLASLFLSEHQPNDVEGLVHSNLLFGTQLVEAMTQTGVHRLVNTGTAWQHFQGHDYNPVNFYAATKQAFEVLLQYYVDVRNLRVITLKLPDTYGPDDPRPKLINVLFQLMHQDRTLAMSPGEQLIDLVHVEDVANAFMVAGKRVIEKEANTHEQFSITSNACIQLRGLVGLFEQILNQPMPVDWGGRAYRKREVMKPWVGEQLPGWTPNISLKSGLIRMLEKNSD